jgi:hypothetical protein
MEVNEMHEGLFIADQKTAMFKTAKSGTTIAITRTALAALRKPNATNKNPTAALTAAANSHQR